jgi:proton-translocating NADH-quinone oxidoreductase chain M
LPEAHVEAPTIGSVILAALLLKLGGYGLLKFCLPFFPFANIYYHPLVLTICTISIIYSTLTAIRQNDLKRIIAYSSISHMNFVVLGIFSLNFEGIFGSILLMLGHAIISSALFFLIGILYERHNTRLIKYFGGILQIMPIFSSILFFFIISNISFPGTANFIGEFLILFGLIKENKLITIIISISLIFTLIYNILLYNKLCMGNLKIKYIKSYQDLNFKEFLLFIPLIIINLYIGIKPEIFYDLLKNNIFNFIIKYK